MSKLKIRAFAGVALALAVASGAVAAQGWRPPTESQRCPSKWGAGDERGAGNHMKPEAVLRATRLIRTGEVIELGHVLGAGMPMNPARVFNLSNPGLGFAAAEWLAKQDPILLGADTAPVEVSPNPDSQLSLPVHQIALVVNGIHLLENLKLDELASKRIHEFALTMQPLKLRGGTGSTVAPAAIR